MADIKNFGLSGVAPEVQLGKSGPRVRATQGAVEVMAGTALTFLRAAPGTLANDVVTVSQLEALSGTVGNLDGFEIPLGDPTKGDGSFTNPAGAVVLSSAIRVSDAIDSINEILGLLVPAQPPQLTATTLTVTSVGSSPLLASGAIPDNTSGGVLPASAGQSATRITAASVTSNTFNDVGPGNSGTISLLLNGSTAGSRAMTTGSDNGTYTGLVIADDKAFPPSTPGFWESVDVSVSRAVDQGWNRIRLAHSNNTPTQTNEVYFVRDNVTAAPTVSGVTISQAAAGTQAFSSSVPHYGTGGQLTLTGAYTNAAGEFYFNGNPLTVTGSNSIITSQSFSYANIGVATPIARQTTAATTITPVTINVNGTVFNSGTITAQFTNVNGSGSQAASGTVLVFNNNTQGVNENNITVTTLGTGSGNAVRVGGLGASDTPSSLSRTAWVSSESILASDAAVVAGVLSHNQINYSTGFFPAGPNLSTGRTGAQYITFAITRSAVSTFRIAVTGTYAGVWIGLPGVSDNAGISPNALGGAWWNAFAAYNGSGVPGRTGDATAGCASGTVMSGTSGTFTITFGTQSSTNATGNVILVRFRLNSGQSVTALSFSN